MPRLTFAIVAALFALAACSESPAPECRVGADCASGACTRDGVCVPLSNDAGGTQLDGGGDDASSMDAGLVDDAGNPITSDGGVDGGSITTDAGSTGCLPNADGVLERREVPIGAGLHAKYRGTIEDVSVNTEGTPGANGTKHWDFTAMLSGDEEYQVITQPLDGKWYASDFPSATYVSPLSHGSSLLGVFEVTETSLLLLGVVSPDNDLSFTNLSYDPPVEVLQFPMQLGKTWTTDSWVTGFYNGITVGLGYSESYAYEVTAAGDVLVPYSNMPQNVLRLSVELTKTVGFLVTTTRTHTFLAECLGPIASVVSTEGETNVDFTTASEIRRLAP